MYHVGRTESDRKHADDTFLKNMILVIQNETRFGWLARLRIRAARTFYRGVDHYGKTFYNHGKSLLKKFIIGEDASAKEV